MVHYIHAGLLPHLSCFAFASLTAGLLDFGAFFLSGFKVDFLELLAFAICVRQGTDVGEGQAM